MMCSPHPFVVVRLLRWPITALAAAGLCLTLSAGEKLNISGAKTRIQPGRDDKSASRLQSFNKLRSPSPYENIAPLAPPSQRKARLSRIEKQMKNERDERKNWALLEPGTLQEAEGDEYDLGVRDYDLDDLEKQNENRDYTFYGLDKTRSQDRSDPATARFSANNRRLSQSKPQTGSPSARTRSLANQQAARLDGKENPNPFRITRSSEESSRLGPHMASELDFNGMLKSSEKDAGLHQSLGASQTALHNILGGSSTSSEQREYNQAMESFRDLLNANTLNQGRLSDPLKFPSDKTRQPLNPVVSSPANPASGNFSPGTQISGPSPLTPSRNFNESRFQIGSNPSLDRGLPSAPPPGSTFPQNQNGPQNFSPVLDLPRRKL